ncbi:MAG: cytochrome b [Xanthomonadaceae bacterium]|nr:cytochrome b [Xanthomonadaceae bacterium]
MSFKNTPDRWGAISQSLHWIVVVLILVMAYLGLTMGDLPNGPDKIKTYALHKSIGLTILGLVGLRVLWRLYAGTPHPVPNTPRWQERIAALTHLAIYALLFAIPISGWVLNSAAGFPLQWFGVVNLPHIVDKSHDLHELAEEAHEIMFWLLALLVVAHAGAAFYHHLFQRDATLARMLPRGWIKLDTPNATEPPSSSSSSA